MNIDINDSLPVDEWKDPVKIKEEDFTELKEIQARVEYLSKYRQEIGRLYQALNNLVEKANEVEIELARTRRELAHKYNLENMGLGQWALDFEKKEFVKILDNSPVIP